MEGSMARTRQEPIDERTAARWLGRVEQTAERYELPGVGVAVAHRGRPVCSAGVGLADMRTERAVRPDSVFRLASITKLFTATAVLMLAEQGCLAVDDPVGKHVREFPDRSITLRHLLAHGAGLQRETPGDPGWRTGEFLEGDDLLRAIGRAARPFSPLERWKYSNLGYTTLGEVVSRVSGVPYRRFVEDRVIEPLGMRSTGFDPSAFPPARLTRGYRRRPDGGVEPEPAANDPVPDAPGQLFSTAPDLCRMAGLLCGDLGDRSPLSPATVAVMRSPQIMADASWKQGHGLGPMLFRVGGRVLVGHAGGLWGHAGWLLTWPERHVGAAALTNVGDGEPLFPVVVALVREAASAGLEPKAERHDLPPPPDVEGLLGRYWGDTLDFSVRWHDGGIVVTRPRRPGLPPPSPMPARLTGRNTLVFDDGPYVGEAAILERDRNGRVIGWEVCTYRFDRAD
jgi:CubicO group peptidase (beta-lactamase class C family)